MKILLIGGEQLTKKNTLLCVFELEQAKALKDLGHQVVILSYGEELSLWNELKKLNFNFIKLFRVYKNTPKISQFIVDGIPIISVNTVYVASKFRRTIETNSAYIGKIGYKHYVKNFGNVDIVHAHSRFLIGGLIGLAVKKYTNIPLVITEHSSFFHRNLCSKKDLRLISQVINKCDKWLVVSKKLGSLITSKISALQKEFQVIGNVLSSDFEHVSLNIGKKDNSITLINIASHDENKNQSLLLKAFAEVKDEHKQLSLKLIGKGELTDYYRKLSKKLNIENKVSFLGNLPHKTVIDELLKSDILIHTSQYETFGAVIIEALACGKPVVSTHCGVADSLIKEHNGMLVKNNIESCKRGIINIINNMNSYDATKIRNEVLSKYSSHTFASRLVNIYKEVIHKK